MDPWAESPSVAVGTRALALERAIGDAVPSWLWLVFAFQGLVFAGLLWVLLQQQRTTRELVRALIARPSGQ